MHDTESETKRIRTRTRSDLPHGRRRVEQLALMNRLLLLLGLLGVAAGLRDCLELRLKLLLALLVRQGDAHYPGSEVVAGCH